MRKETYLHGEQPAADLLRARGYSQAGVARVLGVTLGHLSSALKGQVRPSHELRVRLTELLGVPLPALFTPDAAEVPYRAQHNSRPLEQRGS